MASLKKRWTISSDRFLSLEQVEQLNAYLVNRRDLAIARGTDTQAIRDYYAVRALLESSLLVLSVHDEILRVAQTIEVIDAETPVKRKWKRVKSG